MSEAITSSTTTNQWLPENQYQYQTINDHHVGFSDSISVSLAPESSYAGGNDLSPRGNIGKPPVRRRSRTSRRTPTTLLNASIKNFRTLVQQYTGCQSVTPPMSINQKGPINLSFGSSSDHDVSSINTGNFGGGYNYGAGEVQFQEQNYQNFHHHQEQHVQVYQGQQSNLFSSEENIGEFSGLGGVWTNYDDCR